MPIPVACACGASFTLKDEAAGKRFKCTKCGASVAVPTPLGLAPPGEGAPCPGCAAPMPPGSVVCLGCGFDTRTGTRRTAEKKKKTKKAGRPSGGGLSPAAARRLVGVGGLVVVAALVGGGLFFALRGGGGGKGGGGGGPEPDTNTPDWHASYDNLLANLKPVKKKLSRFWTWDYDATFGSLNTGEEVRWEAAFKSFDVKTGFLTFDLPDPPEPFGVRFKAAKETEPGWRAMPAGRRVAFVGTLGKATRSTRYYETNIPPVGWRDELLFAPVTGGKILPPLGPRPNVGVEPALPDQVRFSLTVENVRPADAGAAPADPATEEAVRVVAAVKGVTAEKPAADGVSTADLLALAGPDADTPPRFAAYLARAGDDRGYLRTLAVTALIARPDAPKAAGAFALAEALRTPADRQRPLLAAARKLLPPGEVLAALLTHLAGAKGTPSYEVLDTLAAVGGADPAAVLAAVESGPLKGPARAPVVAVLGRMDPKPAAAVPFLKKLLADGTAEEQAAAVTALGRIGPPDPEVLAAVRKLATSTSRDNSRTHMAALAALGGLADPDVPTVSLLMSAARSPVPGFDTAGVTGLAALCDRHPNFRPKFLPEARDLFRSNLGKDPLRYYPVLRAADPDGTARDEHQTALALMLERFKTVRTPGTLPVAVERYAGELVTAAALVARLKPPDTVTAPFAEALKDESPTAAAYRAGVVRAVAALGAAGRPAAGELKRLAANDPDAGVKAAAAAALKAVGE